MCEWFTIHGLCCSHSVLLEGGVALQCPEGLTWKNSVWREGEIFQCAVLLHAPRALARAQADAHLQPLPPACSCMPPVFHGTGGGRGSVCTTWGGRGEGERREGEGRREKGESEVRGAEGRREEGSSYLSLVSCAASLMKNTFAANSGVSVSWLANSPLRRALRGKLGKLDPLGILPLGGHAFILW